jgi:sodium-dependent dicarboxylate transporter 2/3/5
MPSKHSQQTTSTQLDATSSAASAGSLPVAANGTGKVGRWGRFLGPVFAIVTASLLSSYSDLASPSIATAAIVMLMAIWWMTEAIPLAATAMLPLALFPLFGIGLSEAQAPKMNQRVLWNIPQVVYQDYHQQTPQTGTGILTEINQSYASVTVETKYATRVEVDVYRIEKQHVKAARSANLFEVTARNYASRYVFLLMGGFLLGLAIEKWNLHKRIALYTILALGTQPPRLIGGFMITTAMLSMWISNTATTVVMLPIALSLVALVRTKIPAEDESKIGPFAACMMLCIAYAASVGGLATFMGTPTNLLLRSELEDHGIFIGFGQWMAFGLPVTIVFLLIIWLLMTKVIFRISLPQIKGGRQMIRDEISRLGPMSKPEISVAAIFACTALLWISRRFITESEWVQGWLPNIVYVDDTVIAMSAALLLFIFPAWGHPGRALLDWTTARKLPWGILLLFGGGLALAAAMKSSGLGADICQAITPSAATAILLIILVVTSSMVFLTEVTSNTATAALIFPLLIQLSDNLGADARLLLFPAALAASCAFMLPVATPPNAIVFASGHVTIRQMARAGIILNIVSIVLIPLITYTLGKLVFGF